MEQVINQNYIITIHEIILYYNNYKCLPGINEIQNNMVEYFMRLFLDTQKEKYFNKSLTNTEYILLCEIPTFVNELNFIDFQIQINNIINYYNKYKILPKSYNKNEETKKMGEFLDIQNDKYIDEKLTFEHINLLFKIPTYKSYLTSNTLLYVSNLTVDEKYLYIKNYYDEYGCLPKTSNKNRFLSILGRHILNLYEDYEQNINIYEYNLYIQITEFRYKLINFNNVKRIAFIHVINEFCFINKRLPVNTNQYEKEMYIFLCYQKKLFKHGLLSMTNYDLLTNKCDIIKNYIDK